MLYAETSALPFHSNVMHGYTGDLLAAFRGHFLAHPRANTIPAVRILLAYQNLEMGERWKLVRFRSSLSLVELLGVLREFEGLRLVHIQCLFNLSHDSREELREDIGKEARRIIENRKRYEDVEIKVSFRNGR